MHRRTTAPPPPPPPPPASTGGPFRDAQRGAAAPPQAAGGAGLGRGPGAVGGGAWRGGRPPRCGHAAWPRSAGCSRWWRRAARGGCPGPGRTTLLSSEGSLTRRSSASTRPQQPAPEGWGRRGGGVRMIPRRHHEQASAVRVPPPPYPGSASRPEARTPWVGRRSQNRGGLQKSSFWPCSPRAPSGFSRASRSPAAPTANPSSFIVRRGVLPPPQSPSPATLPCTAKLTHRGHPGPGVQGLNPGPRAAGGLGRGEERRG